MDEFEYSDKVIDKEGHELDKETLDWSLGYVYPDRELIEHVPATEGRPTKRHYEVNWIQLDDGEKIIIEDSYNSPWFTMVNDQDGTIDLTPQDDHKIVAVDFKEIVDDWGEPARDAYNKYLEFSRWVWYTPEELEAREEQKRIQQEKENFLSTGPDRLKTVENDVDDTESRLTETELNVEDLTLLMAEMIGV